MAKAYPVSSFPERTTHSPSHLSRSITASFRTSSELSPSAKTHKLPASHRGGVRITLICGKTAYDELSARYSDILRLSDMLCAPHGGVPDAVSDLIVRNEALKRELSLQKEAVLKRIADAAEHSDGNLCVFADGLNSDDVRTQGTPLPLRPPV